MNRSIPICFCSETPTFHEDNVCLGRNRDTHELDMVKNYVDVMKEIMRNQPKSGFLFATGDVVY